LDVVLEAAQLALAAKAPARALAWLERGDAESVPRSVFTALAEDGRGEREAARVALRTAYAQDEVATRELLARLGSQPWADALLN
jgi:hypothetical protein